jgi:hypothetical protein
MTGLDFAIYKFCIRVLRAMALVNLSGELAL